MSESSAQKTENMDVTKESSCEQLEGTEKDITIETKDKIMEVVELPPTTAAPGERAVYNIDFIESIKGNTAMINKVIQESMRRRRKRKRDKRKAKLRVKRTKAEPLPSEPGSSHTKKEAHTYTYTSSSDDEIFSITVSNLPNTWTYLEIKNYLDQQCGHVDEIEMLKVDNSNKFGAIRLTFQSSNECLQAMKKLYNKEVEGCQLTVKMNDTDNGSDSDTNTVNIEDLNDMKPWRPDLDPWDIDPSGLYGLKLQFLTSLNIKPPIDKWVQVSNFRCDKSELRDVMELAGHVLQCSLLTAGPKYAKVMYNHPLEAVQAVSMLNGQTFYGKTLKVIMDKTPNDTVILPKGLSAVGLGLGEKGKPVRNITEHYKRYVNQQPSLVNSLLFEKVAIGNDTIIENAVTDDANDKNDGAFAKKPFKVINVGDLNNYGVDQEKDDSDNSADEVGVKVASPNPGKPNETRKLSTTNPSAPNAPKISQNIPDKNIRPQFGPVGPMGSGHALLPNPGFNPMGPRPTFGPNNFQRPYFPNPAVLPMSPGNYTAGPRPFIGPMPHPNGHPRQPLNLSGPRQPMHPNGPLRQPMNPIGAPRHPLKPLNLSGPLRQPQVPGRLPEPMLMGAPIPRPFSPQMSNKTGSSTVEMCNLPPSTTFPLLCERLSHCGQVVSLQFTTPGCAVVVFAQRSHAEMCYQKFNRYTVDGFMIEVKYR